MTGMPALVGAAELEKVPKQIIANITSAVVRIAVSAV